VSYKKKQHWYITGRSKHHHTNKPITETNAPDTTHHHPQPHGRGDRGKPPTPAPSSPTMCHGEAATRCKLERPLSSSTVGLSPSNCTSTLVDPSDLVKLQQTLSSRYQGQPLILTSSCGGLASSTASLLCQRLRYLRPHREHLLRPAVTEFTTATCMAAQDLKHPRALRTLTAARNPQQLQTTSTTSQAAWLQMRCLQEGHDATVPPSHVRWTRFPLENPARRERSTSP
jgi:hypothetical protein